MDIQATLIDFLKIILGGIIGGGIVAWIEWQRLRRQRTEWALVDKKVEIRVIESQFVVYRWSVEGTKDKDEQLRLYKSKLDGKLREWDYLVKVSVVNTTPTELLALSADLQIPQFDIERIELDKQYRRPPQLPFRYTYDLLGKNRLAKEDFPIAIPPKSAMGFVFFGGWFFDAPNLVDDPPITATFTVRLDDKTEHKTTIIFEETDGLDLRYTPTGNLEWSPHLEKYPHLYNSDTESVSKAEDDVPF